VETASFTVRLAAFAADLTAKFAAPLHSLVYAKRAY